MEARKDELQKLKDGLPKFIQDVKDLPSGPTSLGLAIQIEMIFSQELLQQLLNNTHHNIMAAGRLLNFLKTRWEWLSDTAALGPYSRGTKINRACVITAKYFAHFSTDLILQQIINFDEKCKEEEKQILEKNKAKLEDITEELEKDNQQIYKYIYHTVFSNQSIKNAMNFIPQSDENIKTDNWRKLLDGIIDSIPNRTTFIQILSGQVERKDWRFFISKIQHFDLYHLILRLNVDALLKLHKQKPAEKQGNNEFDLELLEAADELLHRKRGMFSYPGDVFKGLIEADHQCETNDEVSALAFCLLETYRRIREKLDEYANPVGRMASYFTVVCTKQDKVDACDLIMQFILTGASFTKDGLQDYIEAEKSAGRLKLAAYSKFKIAIEQGALKTLLDAMFEVQKKVARMAPRAI